MPWSVTGCILRNVPHRPVLPPDHHVELAVFVALLAVMFFMGIAGAIDAAWRPSSAWKRADRSQLSWIIVQACVLIPPLVVLGGPAAITYLVSVRPRVQAAAVHT